jgi:hypothetical protein
MDQSSWTVRPRKVTWCNANFVGLSSRCLLVVLVSKRFGLSSGGYDANQLPLFIARGMVEPKGSTLSGKVSSGRRGTGMFRLKLPNHVLNLPQL